MKKHTQIFELWEIPRGSKIHEDCFNNAGEKIGSIITFHHTDGMYSYCTIDDAPGDNNIIHLSVKTPLRKVNDHYEIAEGKNAN